jgi:hypothetical protein
MSFAVNSISVETVRLARAIAVMQRRPFRSKLIASAGVYNCKTDAPGLYSAHAFGDAVDLMCYGSNADREAIAKAAIADATSRTVANRGTKTEVDFVIFNTTQWTRADGFKPYTGVPHDNHVHMACSYSVTKRPLCAGGANYDIPYLHGQRG